MQKFLKLSNKLYFLLILLVFILGFFLRTKVYLVNQSFWHDECALAWNILNRSCTELFQPLRFLQAAPILFLIDTKFLVKIFGTNELVFRAIPFISSILSIIAFYFLSKKILDTKVSVFFANLLFAINFALYYYCAEFKPYSSDVLFCILAFLIYEYLNSKNFPIYSLILATFIWFSFPAVFIITAIIIAFIFDKNFKLKEKILFIIPQILSGLIFYNLFFINMFNKQKTGMTNYWNEYFFNIENFRYLLQNAFNFMFKEETILLFLALTGLIILLKNKNIFGKLTLILGIILITSSALKFYPFFERLILFLIPINILLIVKSFDKKHYISIFLFIIFLFGFYPQMKNTIKIIAKNNYIKNNPNPREMALYLRSHLKENDIIYVNKDSNSDYLYYKEIYNIKNKELIDSPQYINKNDNIWFFLPNNANDFYKNYILENYEVNFENKNNSSFLIYAKKIK